MAVGSDTAYGGQPESLVASTPPNNSVKRLFLLALVPNILIASFFSLVGALSPYNQAPGGGGLSDESLFIIPIVFVTSCASAFLMAAQYGSSAKRLWEGSVDPRCRTN